jgi:hypothetical protein
MEALRRRLSYANVMASVAVFVSLGGGAYAAVSLPRNSVGEDQLRRGAVTKSRIAHDSVGQSELRDGSVTKSALTDWVWRQVRRGGSDGRDGPVGPEGPPGPPGPSGPAGPGSKAIRFAAEASTTPNPVQVLSVDGLRVDLSCDQSGADTALNNIVHSTQAGAIEETVASDSGANPPGFAAPDIGALRFEIPAGVTPTGGPAASAGYSRVSVDGVYTSSTSTVQIRLVMIVDADADTCSAAGVAVPAA